MALTLPTEPLDPAEVDDVLGEHHELLEALDTPPGVWPADLASYCRDLLDAALEAAGFAVAENLSHLGPAELGQVLALLPADDLLTLARGGDLPPAHPWLRMVRGEAA